MTKSIGDHTPEELAQRLFSQGNHSYAQARHLLDKAFVGPEAKREAGELLDQWERAEKG